MNGKFKNLAKKYSLIRLEGKKPIEKGWEKYCQEKRDFDEIGFKKGDNAGITCGPASGILVIDVDDQKLFEEACQKNGWFLPPTRTHKTGKGGFHFLFNYPPGEEDYGNKSLKKFGIDIRGKGGQIVAPGSVHPETGNLYKVHSLDAIAEPPQWLLSLYDPKESDEKVDPLKVIINLDHLSISEKVKKIIIESRPVGQRSEAMMTVLNALVGAGLNDTEIKDIFDTYPIGEKYREKRSTKEKWLQFQIEKARNWLKKNHKIDACSQNLPKITGEAWIALSKNNNPPRIFQHVSGIIRVVNGFNGISKVENIGVDELRYELTRAVDWFKQGKSQKQEAYPPSIICRDMLANPNPPLPVLERLIFHPIYSKDGILHIEDGYNDKTKCYFARPHNLVIPEVPQKPKKVDLSRAKEILEELFSGFPFVSKAEKANSKGLLILPFIRPMIQGPTPLHLIEAPMPGTGKTLLAKAISFPSLGVSCR
jgi:hypothetical protein